MVPADIEMELRGVIDRYRSRCLWFLREDYYPGSVEERERILDLIARHGDLDAFRLVARLRTWLSRPSSDASVNS